MKVGFDKSHLNCKPRCSKIRTDNAENHPLNLSSGIEEMKKVHLDNLCIEMECCAKHVYIIVLSIDSRKKTNDQFLPEVTTNPDLVKFSSTPLTKKFTLNESGA